MATKKNDIMQSILVAAVIGAGGFIFKKYVIDKDKNVDAEHESYDSAAKQYVTAPNVFSNPAYNTARSNADVFEQPADVFVDATKSKGLSVIDAITAGIEKLKSLKDGKVSVKTNRGTFNLLKGKKKKGNKVAIDEGDLNDIGDSADSGGVTAMLKKVEETARAKRKAGGSGKKLKAQRGGVKVPGKKKLPANKKPVKKKVVKKKRVGDWWN